MRTWAQSHTEAEGSRGRAQSHTHPVPGAWHPACPPPLPALHGDDFPTTSEPADHGKSLCPQRLSLHPPPSPLTPHRPASGPRATPASSSPDTQAKKIPDGWKGQIALK